jgi:kynurenine formamidase
MLEDTAGGPTVTKWPSYAQLPIRDSAPAGAAWGVFGDDDELGTLNFIGVDQVRMASTLVRRGAMFPLNWSLSLPKPVLFHRGAYTRTQKGIDKPIIGHDDYLDGLYLHASSHWDALRHHGVIEAGAFYGGRETSTVRGTTCLDIATVAQRGIATRAVLADVVRMLADEGVTFDPLGHFPVTLEMIERTLAVQGVTLRQGDVLLVRTGWMEAYLGADQARRDGLAGAQLRTVGLTGVDIAGYLWDRRVAAIAADNPAVEILLGEDLPLELHNYLIGRLGMPLGELWFLEDLARDCREDGVYEAFLTSAPLNLPGGTGSPPNALALK